MKYLSELSTFLCADTGKTDCLVNHPFSLGFTGQLGFYLPPSHLLLFPSQLGLFISFSVC